MSGIFKPNEQESKRWLIGLAAACLVCAAWVVHGVITALKPESALVHKTHSVATAKAGAGDNFSDLSSPVTPESQQMYTPVPTNVIERVVSPAEARAEYVHRHAEWLRQMAKDPGNRKAIGYLTPDQINTMEKNGITVE